MEEENIENQIDDDDLKSNFPIFQQKQVAEFIKSILGENYQTQKAFRDKFNRCLSLFAFYVSHMVTVMKIENKKKKNEKIKQIITKNDIIAALKLINFQELASTLENLQINTPQKQQIEIGEEQINNEANAQEIEDDDDVQEIQQNEIIDENEEQFENQEQNNQLEVEGDDQ